MTFGQPDMKMVQYKCLCNAIQICLSFLLSYSHHKSREQRFSTDSQASALNTP